MVRSFRKVTDTAEEREYKIKRDTLIQKWIKSGMVNPRTYWSKTNQGDKITMVGVPLQFVPVRARGNGGYVVSVVLGGWGGAGLVRHEVRLAHGGLGQPHAPGMFSHLFMCRIQPVYSVMFSLFTDCIQQKNCCIHLHLCLYTFCIVKMYTGCIPSIFVSVYACRSGAGSKAAGF